MSRIIKFRVWANRENRWCIESEYVGCEWGIKATSTQSARVNLHLGMGMREDEIERYRREAFTIEQFTGLFDKAGREIYEGDIVCARWSAPCGDMEQSGVIKYGVYQDGEGFLTIGFYEDYMMGAAAVDGESGSGLSPNNTRWEVVGNVHQNPELLIPPY